MGTSLNKFSPCLNAEQYVIEEVGDLKEDIKQYDFDVLVHDELATNLNFYIMNIHSYNI